MQRDFVLDITAQGAWNGGTRVDNSVYENTGMQFKGGIPVTRESIEERIGVRTRMAAPEGERIGVAAFNDLLSTSGIDPSRIRVLIAATNLGEDKYDPGPPHPARHRPLRLPAGSRLRPLRRLPGVQPFGGDALPPLARGRARPGGRLGRRRGGKPAPGEGLQAARHGQHHLRRRRSGDRTRDGRRRRRRRARTRRRGGPDRGRSRRRHSGRDRGSAPALGPRGALGRPPRRQPARPHRVPGPGHGRARAARPDRAAAPEGGSRRRRRPSRVRSPERRSTRGAGRASPSTS